MTARFICNYQRFDLTRERLWYDTAVNPKTNHDPITHGTLSSEVQVPCQYSYRRSLFLEFVREQNYSSEVCFGFLYFGRQGQIGAVRSLIPLHMKELVRFFLRLPPAEFRVQTSVHAYHYLPEYVPVYYTPLK